MIPPLQPIILNSDDGRGGVLFDYICDINLRKNGDEIFKYGPGRVRFNSYSDAYSESDDDEFCRFRIPPLLHWKQEQKSGVYIICQQIPEITVVYVGETGNLAYRFNKAYGYISQYRDTGQGARINKKILRAIEARNLLKIYFHNNVPDKSKRLEIESDLIRDYDPPWNIAGRGNGSQGSGARPSTKSPSSGSQLQKNFTSADEERLNAELFQHSPSSDNNSKKCPYCGCTYVFSHDFCSW